MISLRTLHRGLFIIALALMAGGCLPSASDPLEEQREPHFLNGKSRVNAMDYKGALESFEKALEVNPHSAAAHFELGLLYEDKEQDYAAAIYHYEQFLKLRPNSDNADILRQRIISSKQELAKAVSLAPLQQNLQRDLERYAAENRELRQKLDAWQAYFTAHGQNPPAMTNSPVASAAIPPAAPTRPNPPLQPTPVQITGGSRPIQPARAARTTKTIGTYTLKSGDTPASVARKYGIKLDALLAANPGVDPKHLKIGQILSIPAP